MYEPERLYLRGFQPSDFVELADNLLLLEPLRRPAKLGAIHTAGTDPQFESLCFRVLAKGRPTERTIKGEHIPADPFRLDVGDIVAIRNALAEPIQHNLKIYMVDARWVWGVVDRAAAMAQREAEEAERQAAAKADIEAERSKRVVRF